MSIEFEKVFPVANKLCHSVFQYDMIEFFIILAPFLDLNASYGTA